MQRAQTTNKGKMIKEIKTTNIGRIKAILMIFHFHLNLSELEIDIISILLDKKIKDVNTDARDLIRNVLNRDKFTTNNYIKRLKEKKIILQDGKKLSVNPNVIALASETTLTFSFIL